MPYNYTLAYRQFAEAKPLISPLYYYFGNDSAAAKVEDQFMWGDAVMVAPVLDKAASERSVYLPKGTWYDYYTHQVFNGGQQQTVPVAMDHIPVYVKGGSFIPSLTDTIMNTTVYSTAHINVTYFPSSGYSSYTLYDDDGTSRQSVEKNEFELITFETEGVSRESAITIRSNGGKFSGKPAERQLRLVVPGLRSKPATVTVNNQPLLEGTSIATYAWNEESKTLEMRVAFKGDSLQLKWE